MAGSIKDLVNYRFEKSKNNLEIAKKLLREENCSFALNRAYYAAFDARRSGIIESINSIRENATTITA